MPGYHAVFLIPHTNASLKQAAKDWCAGGERKEAVKRRFGPIEEWGVSDHGVVTSRFVYAAPAVDLEVELDGE